MQTDQKLDQQTDQHPDQNIEYVTVETDLLKSRIALVSLDTHSMSAGRRYLREMRKIMMHALLNGNDQVSVPHVWFRELEAAYILLF